MSDRPAPTCSVDWLMDDGGYCGNLGGAGDGGGEAPQPSCGDSISAKHQDVVAMVGSVRHPDHFFASPEVGTPVERQSWSRTAAS